MSLPVYSFVGYSGSGKTTFLENLIPELKKKGLRVAVIKHDAREFEVDHEGKDSWRMTKAGADVTCITSSTHGAIMENRPIEIENVIGALRNVDIVLAEGYKQKNYKKIGVFREASQLPLPDIQDEYFAIVTDKPLQEKAPQFALDDYEGVAEFLANDMGEKPFHNELYGAIQLKLGRRGAEEASIGKGLIQLLEGIEQYGSINLATKEMKMAYSKAWKVINNAEERTNLKLVERNGPNGSALTREGKMLVRLFGELSRQAQFAIDDWLAGGSETK